MPHYQKHIFFCTNHRPDGRACCQDHHASDFRDYFKSRLKALDLHGPGKFRVSTAGCLGRCALGPTLVIYPEAIWYTYQTEADLDEVITETLQHNRVVERLLLPE